MRTRLKGHYLTDFYSILGYRDCLRQREMHILENVVRLEILTHLLHRIGIG